jgi:hypothetical protein
LQSSASAVVLRNLRRDQLYAYQICAVFNRSYEDIDWTIVNRFPLDLRGASDPGGEWGSEEEKEREREKLRNPEIS